MKKFKIVSLFLLVFLLNYKIVFGLHLGGSYGQYMGLDQIEITKDRTQYIIRGSYVKRPTLAEKQNFVFDKQNAAHYNYKIEEWIQPYASNTYLNGFMNDAGELVGRSVLIPPELYTWRVFDAGGTSGSCKSPEGKVNCAYRDNPSNWHEMQQTNQTYLAEAYPNTLDTLVYVSRADEDNPVKFGTGVKFPNKIIDNGKVDSEGRYIAVTPLKVYQSEYNSGSVSIIYSSNRELERANLFFSSDGYKYIEKYEPEGIYDDVILDNGQTSRKWTGKYKHKVYIDKSKNVIHGLFFREHFYDYVDKELYKEASPAVNNLRKNTNSDTTDISYIYEFEIPIEIVPDENKPTKEEPKNKVLTGMQDNNARIFIDDKEISILNKKDYDLGRIYVSLEDICKNVENCKIEQAKDDKNQTFYRITRKILDTDIEFSLVHYPETNIFETSVYKSNSKTGYDIISPAKGSIDASSKIIDNVLYVPIRFLLQGLGANITYTAAKENIAPEEVHISFNDTENVQIESSTLKKSGTEDKYKTNSSENEFKIILDKNESNKFYGLQIGLDNAPLNNLSELNNYSVVFPSTNVYNYLFIGKVNYNNSEMLIYKKIDFEYTK